MKMRMFIVVSFIWFTGVTFSHAAFINDPAPAFELTDMEGKTAQLSDYQGQVVFINFWASWCPPCKKEFPELNELANEYKEHGVQLLAINLDKNKDRIQSFLDKNQLKPEAMKILMDPQAKVVAQYIARSMPSSFIIDGKGVIRFVHFGYSEKDPAKWREEVEFLRNESKNIKK